MVGLDEPLAATAHAQQSLALACRECRTFADESSGVQRHLDRHWTTGDGTNLEQATGIVTETFGAISEEIIEARCLLSITPCPRQLRQEQRIAAALAQHGLHLGTCP